MTAQPYAPPPMMPPAKPAKFAALAWAALILGIVGVVGSPIVFLNNLTAVIAGVGFILGVIALFGSKKILAGIGAALCVAAVVFTVIAQQAAVEKLDEILDGTTNRGQAGRGEGGVPADSPTWGKRYTWENGLAVDVAAPVACKPSDTAAPPSIERAVKISVVVTNGTSEPFDATLLSLGGGAQFGGATADQIYDFGGECGGGLESATVLPGKTFTYSVAYAVGPQPGELQLTFQPAFGADKAIYVGEA